MSTPLGEQGTCSACQRAARRAPNGHWWHEGAECPNRSMTIYQPVAWWKDDDKRLHLGKASLKDLPAVFIPQERP